MSKKTFTAAPKPRQPTADEIAAFEHGGAGHYSRARQGAAQQGTAGRGAAGRSQPGT